MDQLYERRQSFVENEEYQSLDNITRGLSEAAIYSIIQQSTYIHHARATAIQ